MIDNKKEQERDELHRAIWSIADELRGAVDGWDFKNYVLGTMFYRYISENITAYINEGEHKAGNTNFNYALLSDKEAEQAREDLVKEKGFFILPSELFCNVRAKAMNDENLNETLEKIFSHIEESAQGSDSENSFAGLFDDFDVNSNKLGSTIAKRNERLAKLLDGIATMNLGDVKNHNIDAFGDAYEYLMTMYASNAGKSGGEFFTPAAVSELLTRLGTVGKKTINKVYDPACGSGSLLLKSEKVLGKDAVLNGFYGQEINITTYNLCRINMFLHDIGFDKFDIACEDTLINPQHWDDEPFELIVSNPPYSIKWAGEDNPLLINDQRFAPAGVLAPKGKADMAFIMHALSWLAPNGVAAIVCFPGIFSRSGAEQKIRKFLVNNNYIDAIIHLPEKLFYGTPIDTCVLVLKKSKKDTNILFVEATNEFEKFTKNNKLMPYNIDNIVDLYAKRENVRYKSSIISPEIIEKNKYNLSVQKYVEEKVIEEDLNIEHIDDDLEQLKSELYENQNILKIQKNSIPNVKIMGKIEVSLFDYFEVSRGKRLKQTDRSEGDLPFVTAGFQNEGIAEYISNNVEVYSDAITIDMFGNVFWRPYDFGCDDNIIVLKNKYLNEETAFFFLSVIQNTMGKFNYSNQYRLKDLKSHIITLPVIGKELDFESISTISKYLEVVINAENEIERILDKEIDCRKREYKSIRKNILKF